ncbi:MAG: metallophosphoesterase [Kiritimatiellae bacterium]|nr:metallophosphoesterase [Kiritimatiellia bacterium]
MTADLNRRGFIGWGAGMLLAHALPPLFAAPAVSAEAKPIADLLIDRHLKVSSVSLAIGAEKPFKALHFSDTHLSLSDVHDLLAGEEKALALYEARRPRFPVSVQALAATIAYAGKKGMTLLNTGDLFDYRSEANLDCVGRCFAGKDIFSSLGNHESYGHHAREMCPQTAEAADSLRKRYETAIGNPLLVASRVVSGVNFVAFDNGGLERWLLRERLVAIKAALAKNFPVVLMCHMPFETEAMREAIARHESVKRGKAWTMPANTGGYLMGKTDAELLDFLRTRKSEIKAILAGHLHFEWQGEWEGVPMLVAGGNYEGRVREISFT